MAVSNQGIEGLFNDSDEDCGFSGSDESDDMNCEEPPTSDSDDSDCGVESDDEEECSDGDSGQNAERRVGRPRGTGRFQPSAKVVWDTLGEKDEPPKIPFAATRLGFIPPANHPVSELDFFQLFFTNELFETVVAETNRYAAAKIRKSSPLPQSSQWNKWTDVTVQEMKVFFGFVMNMALNNKPRLTDYFATDWLTKQDFFSSVFTRSRFLVIFRALRVDGPTLQLNPADKRGSRSAKVNNLWRYIDAACRRYYAPSEKMAVNESSIGFKRRNSFRCNNAQKPSKWGLKVFVLAESDTGYVCAMEPYFGKSTTENLIRPDLAFTTRIVVHLFERLQQDCPAKGRHLYVDRYFSSIDLARELRKQDTHVTGTLLSNRKELPKEVRAARLKKMREGDVKAYKTDNGEVVTLAWKDIRPVLMLSTYHGKAAGSWRRRRPDGQVIDKPVMIQDYTANMSAVDKEDHWCSNFDFTRRRLEWRRKLLFWLLEIGVRNSYCLFSGQNGRKMDHITFRKTLITQLIGDYRTETRKRRRESDDVLERLTDKLHCPGKLKRGRDCVVCSDRSKIGGRKTTNYNCETCSATPALHVPVCFKKYHTERKYR